MRVMVCALESVHLAQARSGKRRCQDEIGTEDKTVGLYVSPWMFIGSSSKFTDLVGCRTDPVMQERTKKTRDAVEAYCMSQDMTTHVLNNVLVVLAKGRRVT